MGHYLRFLGLAASCALLVADAPGALDGAGQAVLWPWTVKATLPPLELPPWLGVARVPPPRAGRELVSSSALILAGSATVEVVGREPELALALLMVRALLSQMDVPARSAFVMSVVQPHERAAAASFTAVPRSLASAVSPSVPGHRPRLRVAPKPRRSGE